MGRLILGLLALVLVSCGTTPAFAQAIDRSAARAAVDAALQGLPIIQPAAPAPSAAIPRIGSYQPITAKVGVPRPTYLQNLPGGCPCTWGAPLTGTLTGASPMPTYVARVTGQDAFTVRTADGVLHGYFVSGYP